MIRQTLEVQLEPNQTWEKTLDFASLLQGPYMATVLVFDSQNQVLLAARRVLFGMRDPKIVQEGKIEPLDAPGQPVPDVMAVIRDNGCLWGFDATQSMSGLSKSPQVAMFDRMKKVGADIPFCSLPYHQFEPFPGVYNFAYFDHVVANARHSGMLLTLGIWWWDFKAISQWWLADGVQRTQRDGLIPQSRGELFSHFSSHFQQSAKRAVQALVKRYANSPQVVMWHPHSYGRVDHDANGIFDFHPEALTAWADYLSRRYGKLSTLNQAYGSNVADWSSVPVPHPLWEAMIQQDQMAKASRVLDVRPQWLDWLDFYHGQIMQTRVDMMQAVREIDTIRSFPGMSASGGVGKAHGVYQSLVDHKAFYGDQGPNGVELFRRNVARDRYGLPLRLEDISSLIPDKGGVHDPQEIVDRSNWDIFQLGVVAPEHFNYVFPATVGKAPGANNYFFNKVFASPIVKQLVTDANHAELLTQPVALLHSFLTDIYEGQYHYTGISLNRWWRMEGWSEATYQPGIMCQYLSDDCPRGSLTQNRLIIDDGSRVMPQDMVDTLVNYVKNGGELALVGGLAAEVSLPDQQQYPLLKRLGYGDTQGLNQRHDEPGQLVFQKDNPVCRRLVSLPLQFWSALSVLQGGQVVGRVGKDIASVCWTYGKGEVLLLGGIPAAITEGDVLTMMNHRDRTNKDSEKQLWDSW